MSTRSVRDPFLNKTVQVSDNITDRLRGRYATGPTMANGEPEFGWREFPTPPIQKEAADEIDRLNKWADGFSDAQLKERALCEARIQEMQETIDWLRTKIARLGSSEAMTGAFAIQAGATGDELKARLQYARDILKNA